MADSSSHRFIESPGSSSTPLPIHLGSRVCHVDFPGRVWFDVEDGTMHRVRRESLRPQGSQRREPRAVADKRHRASLGERLAADPFVVLLGEDRLPDKSWWTRLVALVNSFHLRRLRP